MRIEQLALERYGIFTDRVLTFDPQAALHVVLGANEAGKTSALSAIGDLLFGFGGRTDYDFRHESKALRIGGTFRRADGSVMAARRRKGNKNTLLGADDQPLADDPFAALLGGVSRIAFDREFGMTAQSLREGGDELLGAGGRLAETLAAGSAGMAELSRIKDRLQAQADELFTPRKSASKPFYLAADRRDTADKALRDAVVTRDALRQAQAAVTEAAERLAALRAAHASSGTTLARWQRTLRVRSPLARLDVIAAELADLSTLPAVVQSVLDDWLGALAGQAAVDAEIVALDAAAAANTAEIAAMQVDDALLAEDAAIGAMNKRSGAMSKAEEDLPRRRHDRDAAEAALEDCAKRLGLASYVDLLARLPTDLALADARERIAAIRRDTQALADAVARHARARQELAEFAAGDGEAQHVADIVPLRQRFDALGDLPGQEERLHRDRAALAAEREALAQAVAALVPAPGPLDRLRALPVPDRVAIGKYASDIELAELELKRLDQAMAMRDDAIAATERELAKLSSSGAVPTRADLLQARQARDARFDALRAGIDGDRHIRIARLDGVAEAARDIDGITDQLLTDTGRATRQEDARRRLAEVRDERGREEDKRTGLRRGIADIDAAWTQLWAASGLQPLTPAEMLRWCERLDEIVTRLDRLDLQRTGIDALAAGLDAGRAATAAFLESVGRQPDSTLPAGVLYREAKARFEELYATWNEARVRAVAKARLERDLLEADADRERIATRLAALERAWPDIMRAIGLAEAASPAHAEAALAVWSAVGVPRAGHEREGRSVATILADLQNFDTDVASLCDRIAPDLRGVAAQEAVSRLGARLVGARSAHDARQRLQDDAAKQASRRSALMARRAATASTLVDACRVLGVADVGALPEPLARLLRRLALQNDQAEQQHRLQETGDGLDEAALRAERDGVDLDRLTAEIDSEAVQQAQLMQDITDASAALRQRQHELDELTKGRDAVGALARRTEAEAEMLSIAEGWLLRSAASLLARRAIDLHRAKVQDPTIAHAGDLFALATADAFAGLGVDYGDADQPTLMARRAAGEMVPVSGLSEGTRDQLFLALRLALLERRTSEPMPFIGDDLLASFDERRTLATLRLLAAAGLQRQMILFTHHRHVADLAASLTEHRIDLIEL